MAFLGLNIATQGLYTAQGGLSVTNHNMSNVNTKGYSRQVINQQASEPMRANAGYGMIGTGSEIISITQMRNIYFDIKFWDNNKTLGEYSVKSSQMQQLEALFNEPSDTGFTTIFNNLFEQLQTMSTSSGDTAYRATVRDALINFTEYFNNTATQLKNFQRECNFAVKTKVDEINYLGEQISNLNRQIGVIELDGTMANDLRDKRANLIDDLSRIIEVKATEFVEDNGIHKYVVTIDGQTLVDGTSSRSLKVVSREQKLNQSDEPELYDIQWSNGQTFRIDNPNLTGELKGYIDLRDGNNKENFSGAITEYDLDSDTITVSGNNLEKLTRLNLPASGQLAIGNQVFTYESFEYNEATNTFSFKLADGKTLSADDVASISNNPYASVGKGFDYKGIPYYMNRLNEFVRTFAQSFNEIHKQGVNLNGENGKELFTGKDQDGNDIALDESDLSSYYLMTADNFVVAKDILNDVKNIAAVYQDAYNPPGESNNDLLQKLLSLKNDVGMFKQGKPDNFFQALIGEIGIDSKKAQGFEKSQTNILLAIENQRLSYSGVDSNEETMNMLKYQNAYNLAAKMISTMDQIYDTLINKMGV